MSNACPIGHARETTSTVAAFVQAAVRRAVSVVGGRLPDYPGRRRTSKEVASITMLGWTRWIPVLAAQFTYRRFADPVHTAMQSSNPYCQRPTVGARQVLRTRRICPRCGQIRPQAESHCQTERPKQTQSMPSDQQE